MMGLSRWVLAGVALGVVLPLAFHAFAPEAPPRCSLDGATLDPVGIVRVESGRRMEERFCSARCFEQWLELSGPESWRAYVVDVPTGEEIDLSRAWLVRSGAVSSATTGERIYAFAQRADAEAHVAVYGGRLLDRPLRTVE